ncbi:hypothetical protein ABIA35_007317 [Catenulispora sp. MAP12-49]|uniref:hypothetical protein n=1 Tax=Catenulispora sp. MAP12-49 TaxID=3156302 RepID=UPI003519128E
MSDRWRREGGMAGAADAMRRGRRRSLRARGGVAVLGVAAIGGALGVTATLGGLAGGAKAVAAADAPTTTGSPASVPTSSSEPARATTSTQSAPPARGDGLLAANLWPGYSLAHWDPEPTNLPATQSIGSMINHCDTDPADLGKYSFPVTGAKQWGTTYITAIRADAEEDLFVFADASHAAAFLADARGAGTAKSCSTGPAAQVPSPGVSTDYGVSWVVRQQDGGVDHLPSIDHRYLVQSGNRVALLRAMQFGTDFESTSGDAKVLADLQAALEK